MALIEVDLENQCRDLVAQAKEGNTLEPSLPMQREIALTLDHLDRSRRTVEDLLSRAKNSADAVRHRMLNVGSVPYEYAVGLRHERDEVRNQLRDTHLRIEMSRRGILSEYNREVQRLQGQLLGLWNKHEMLKSTHGHRPLPA